MTHNTGDCRKYEKDRIFKKRFKPPTGKSAKTKFDHRSFKTMLDDLKKVKSKLKVPVN